MGTFDYQNKSHETKNLYTSYGLCRKFVGDDLPAVVQPTEGRAEEIPIDVAAVVKAIQEAIEAGNTPDPSDTPTTIPT